MKLFRLTAALAALTLSLAACGGGSSSSSSTPATPAAGGGSSNISSGTGTPVNVTLADFSIDVSGGTKLSSGTYTFNVTNNGPTGHNLTIEGAGVDNRATPTFTSGTQQLTVALKNGTYEFFCSVPGHKEAGMDVKVTVGSGGAGAAGSTTTEDSSGSSQSSGGGGSTESGGGWG